MNGLFHLGNLLEAITAHLETRWFVFNRGENEFLDLKLNFLQNLTAPIHFH